MAHIALPGAASDFTWIAKLDSSALEGVVPCLAPRASFVNIYKPGARSIWISLYMLLLGLLPGS